jgi:hypothetical protein
MAVKDLSIPHTFGMAEVFCFVGISDW